MKPANASWGLVVVAVCVGALNIGCERQPVFPKPVGGGDGAMGKGWVFDVYWGGKYRFVLFTDIGRSTCDVTETHSRRQVHGGTMSFRGQQYAKDGRKVVFHGTVASDGNGTVEVDGQSFDLAGGAVFLVSTGKPSLAVEQMKPETMPDKPTVTKGPITLETLKAFARKDPVLRAFLELNENES